MRIALICTALLCGTPANASLSEITCSFRNDVNLTILASKGKITQPFDFGGGFTFNAPERAYSVCDVPQSFNNVGHHLNSQKPGLSQTIRCPGISRTTP